MQRVRHRRAHQMPRPRRFPGARQTPPVSALRLAMVQGVALWHSGQRHRRRIRAVPRRAAAGVAASVEARRGLATAAHHVLVGLVPPLQQVVRDRLDTLYAEALAAIPDGPPENRGSRRRIRRPRARCSTRGRTTVATCRPRTPSARNPADARRPTPPRFVNDPTAWVANVDPFVLDSPSQFRTGGRSPSPAAHHAGSTTR